ncbi:unnamed protein product [Echinostoma caproni]|uniref:Uncharacterized protein n=1 Tax=Echinostoma caproni TaxID=27848 RepID=A0A3P8FN76_9TREM|nr:unnamed protein product [Echinostoma caproni]
MWYSVMAKLHVSRLPIRPAVQLQLLKLQALWRRDLRQRSRPIEAFLQLYCHYRTELTRLAEQQYSSADGSTEEHVQLCRTVLEEGLRWFRLAHVDKVT